MDTGDGKGYKSEAPVTKELISRVLWRDGMTMKLAGRKTVRTVAGLGLAFICICLVGCVTEATVYPEIAAHRKARFKNWNRERAGNASKQRLISGPLSLEDAIFIALGNSREIRTTILEQEKSKALVTEARAGALPTLGVGADYTRVDHETTLGARDTYGISSTLTQPVYRGGLVRAGIRAARLYTLFVDEQRRAVYQQVIYDVQKAYYDARLALELERASKEAVDVARRHLKVVRASRQSGAASDFDVLRSEVESKNLIAQNLQDGNRRRLASTALLNVMGVSQESRIELSDGLAYRPFTPLMGDAVETAFHERPDLLQAELSVRLQREAVNGARAAHLPDLDAILGHGYDRPDPYRPATGHWGDSWYAGITLSYTVFNGLRTSSRVRQEKITLRQKEVALIDTEEEVLLNIKQALLRLEDAAKLVESQQANVEQARETLRLAELGYKEGVHTEVEIFDTQRALTQAQANYVQAVYEHALAGLAYGKATGTLAPPDTSGITKAAPDTGRAGD